MRRSFQRKLCVLRSRILTSLRKGAWISVAFLLYSHEGLAGFPCDLSQFQKANSEGLPHLYLSGETHEDFYCELDKSMHSYLNSEGKVFLTEEGIFFEEPVLNAHPFSKKKRGYDDPLTHAIGVAKIIHESQRNQEMVLAGFTFMSTIQSNPVLRIEWTRFKKAQAALGSEATEAVAHADQYLTLISGNNGPINKSSDQDLASHKVVGLFFRFFIQRYNDFYRFNYPTSSLLKNPLEEIDAAQLFAEGFDYSLRFIVDLRNRFMADNIAKLYCEAAVQNTPLFVVVGKDHLPGLEQLLSGMSPEVPLQIRDSHRACESLFSSKSAEETSQILAVEYPYLGQRKSTVVDFLDNAEQWAKALGQGRRGRFLSNIPDWSKVGVRIPVEKP